MEMWIVLVLALFVAQTFIPTSLRYWLSDAGMVKGMKAAFGPRDAQPELSPVGQRAQRALGNMHEALPVFLGLALLHVARDTTGSLAEIGAAVFTIARVLYVPLYMGGVPVVRSLVWFVGLGGLGIMAAALFL